MSRRQSEQVTVDILVCAIGSDAAPSRLCVEAGALPHPPWHNHTYAGKGQSDRLAHPHASDDPRGGNSSYRLLNAQLGQAPSQAFDLALMSVDRFGIAEIQSVLLRCQAVQFDEQFA